MSKKDFYGAGKSFEQSKQWSKAIETYLNANVDQVNSIEEVVDIWERSVEIGEYFSIF